MEKQTQNLEQLCKNVSDNILDSIYMIEILEELSDGESKFCILLSIMDKNLKTAFSNIETCRKFISVPD